ncbi:MAG: helix-turn-helix domain-containing protein [Solirubrobacterales bacterium]
MNSGQNGNETSVEKVRRLLATRLRKHLPEIEAAVHQRIRSIVEAVPLIDPEYAAGVQEATREAVDYAIAGIETGTQSSESIPTAVANQARHAARGGVPLETVLRRYHAGDRLLFEWLTGAADDLPVGALQEIARTQGRIIDHLTADIAREYNSELERSRQSPSYRLSERVRALLEGERDGDPSLSYDFAGWHLGLVGSGAGIEKGIREAARQADRQVLCVQGISDGRVWAWLGGRAKPDVGNLELTLEQRVPIGASLCVGEIRSGLEGWRLTHAEAQIAFRVALYATSTITRSRDVVLMSAILREPRLTESIVETFIQPLEGKSGRGLVLRETLRTYFGADQNAATTAHRLQVDRSTVRRRLTTVEELLGLKIDSYGPQLQVALAVEELLSARKDPVGGQARCGADCD